eukprot:344944_1
MGYQPSYLEFTTLMAIGIIFLILLIMNISVVTSARTALKNTKATKRKMLIYLSIAPIMLYGLSITIYFIVGIIVIATKDNRSSKPYTTIIADPAYQISGPIMLLVFTMRLDITFENTKFGYSTGILRASYIISFILIFLPFVFMVNVITGYEGIIAFLLGFFWILADWIFSIILIILYIRKLNLLIIETSNAYTNRPTTTAIRNKKQEITNDNTTATSNQTSQDTTNTIENKNEIEDDYKVMSSMSSTTQTTLSREESEDMIIQHIKKVIDNELLYNMVKNSLLIPIAICSSFVLTIIAIVVANSVPDEGEIVYLTVNIWLSFDLVLNSFCIFCLFEFNDFIYYKCCHVLHNCCQRCKLRKMKDLKGSEILLKVIDDWIVNKENDENVEDENIDTTVIPNENTL